TPNVVNWIRVRVSSTINPSQYGEASVSIVVMEPMILSLAAFRVGSNSSSMGATLVGLQDFMQLQPSVAASSDPLTPITSEDLGPYGSALGYSFSYVDSVTRPDGSASSASVGLAVTPTTSAVDTFTVLAPLFSSTAELLTTAAVTIIVSLSFGGVVAAATGLHAVATECGGFIRPTHAHHIEDLGPYGSALGYSFSYVDSVTRPDGSASSASVGLAVTPTAGAVDTFTVLAPLFSSTALTTAAVTIIVSLSFGGVVAAQANATVTIVAPSDISGVVAAESAKVSAISDPAAAVVMANTLRCLTAWSSTTVQQYLGVATLTLLSRVLSNDDVALLAASDKISILASISSSLVAIEGTSTTTGSSSRTFHAAAASLTSAAITGTAAQQKISYSLLIQSLVIAALQPSADTVDSLSFAYDNYDLILSAIQSMDMSTGGSTAIHLASAVVNAPDLLVGTSMTISSSGTILISVVKELASTLKSATSVGSEGGSSGTVTFRFSGSSGNGVVLNGASLVIPSMTNASDISVLPWTTLQDTDVVGIAATVLSTNPFTTTTTSTLKVASSIVVVDMLLTSPTGAPSVLTVSDMPEDQAWVVTIPNAGQGVSCGYFDDELKNWAKTGVTILLPNASTTPPSAPSTSLQCLTTHLTAFGGIPASSAASTSSVTAIVTAIMAVVVVCFI
ncbi:GPI-anchored surface protein, putative, partial [Bodo saltans]